MTRSSVWFVLAASIAATSFLATPTLGQNSRPTSGFPVDILEQAENTFIFVFQPNLPAAAVDARAADAAARNGGALSYVYRSAIKGFAARVSAEAAARIAARDPDILYYERDGVLSAIRGPVSPNAKPPGGGGEQTPQTVPWGITRVGGPLNGAGTRVWVIDTGVDLDHADLNVARSCSKNFIRTGKNSADDGHGHGTHVAGTIAAIDNAIDVVGVAAGATVCALRVFDNSGSGTVSGIVAAVDYVAAKAIPGEVANMSLGGPGHWQSLHDATLATADGGIPIAIAADNDGADANGYGPAHINHANIYTVSAIDSRDNFAWWSNWGNPPIDVAAPGVGIVSTRMGGGVTTMSGTSMAAPHVAGLLLLGTLSFDGNAINDPDGSADPIAHN